MPNETDGVILNNTTTPAQPAHLLRPECISWIECFKIWKNVFSTILNLD